MVIERGGWLYVTIAGFCSRHRLERPDPPHVIELVDDTGLVFDGRRGAHSGGEGKLGANAQIVRYYGVPERSLFPRGRQVPAKPPGA